MVLDLMLQPGASQRQLLHCARDLAILFSSSIYTCALLAACSLNAQSLMTLDAPNSVTAGPGGITGWDFILTWSSPNEWASITGSALINKTNPLGAFSDFIGLQGGPGPFFALGPSGNWAESFDPVALLGIGSYTVGSGAIPFRSQLWTNHRVL